MIADNFTTIIARLPFISWEWESLVVLLNVSIIVCLIIGVRLSKKRTKKTGDKTIFWGENRAFLILILLVVLILGHLFEKITGQGTALTIWVDWISLIILLSLSIVIGLVYVRNTSNEENFIRRSLFFLMLIPPVLVLGCLLWKITGQGTALTTSVGLLLIVVIGFAAMRENGIRHNALLEQNKLLHSDKRKRELLDEIVNFVSKLDINNTNSSFSLQLEYFRQLVAVEFTDTLLWEFNRLVAKLETGAGSSSLNSRSIILLDLRRRFLDKAASIRHNPVIKSNEAGEDVKEMGKKREKVEKTINPGSQVRISAIASANPFEPWTEYSVKSRDAGKEGKYLGDIIVSDVPIALIELVSKELSSVGKEYVEPVE